MRVKTRFNTLVQIMELGGEVKEWDEYVNHLNEALELIIEKDAPVLAAAMLPDVDFLITVDANHFLNNKKLRNTRWGKKIMKPKDFLTELNREERA